MDVLIYSYSWLWDKVYPFIGEVWMQERHRQNFHSETLTNREPSIDDIKTLPKV